MRGLFYLFSLILFSYKLCFAQNIQQKTLEIPIDKKKGENYHTLLLGNKGAICLHNNSDFIDFSHREIVATLFNTNLDTVWHEKYIVESNLSLIGYAYNDLDINLLFLNNKNKPEILKISLQNGISVKYEVKDLDKFDIQYVEMAGEKVLLGGEIMGSPAIVLLNLHLQEKLYLPSINQLQADIKSIVVDNEKEVIIVFLDGTMGKDRSYFMQLYGFDGKIINKFKLEKDNKYNLLTYRPLINEDAQVLILGTYALKNDYHTQGIYALLIEEGEKKSFRFYDFSNFKNFFNYLPTKKRQKMLENIEKKQSKGKVFPFNYRLSVHELSFDKDLIFFTAESINDLALNNNNMRNSNRNFNYPYGYGWGYPSMSSIPNNNVINSNSLSNTSRGITGANEYYPEGIALDIPIHRFTGNFEYQHVITSAFDFKGNFKWDVSYSFDKTEYEYPIISTQFAVNQDSVIFVEFREKDLRYQTVSIHSDYSSEAKTTELQPIVSKEDMIDFQIGGIRKWTNNTFLATGIREYYWRGGGKKIKKVYYLSKVYFE
ncbi:MAG: hypothetical protein OHK0038_13800 [Flammeovirgaceae bacterium]